MSNHLLTLEGVYKEFAGGRDGGGSTILEDVSFTLAAGEVVTLLGANGAGKTSLLRLAAGIGSSTRGVITRPAVVAALIELGAGFFRDLTAAENVTFILRLLGSSARDVGADTEKVLDFAELAAAAHQPLREFSQGMYMRLGFAVMTVRRAQLLVIDELLAVGDQAFQAKCISYLKAERAAGVGVLLATHNLTTALDFADKVIVLDRGRVAATGPARDIVPFYQAGQAQRPAPSGVAPSTRFSMLRSVQSVAPGQGIAPSSRVNGTVRLAALVPTDPCMLAISVRTSAGPEVMWFTPQHMARLPHLDEGEEVEVHWDLRFSLPQGYYYVDLIVSSDWRKELLRTTLAHYGVLSREGSRGSVDLDPKIRVHRSD